MVPITLLIGAVAITFNPMLSILYAMCGCLAAATVNYLLGMRLGREMVRRLAGGKLSRINKYLVRRGFTMVLLFRLVPMAPYTVVNLVLGASHVRFRDYFIGTVFGMLPGVIILSLFGEGVRQVLKKPSLKSIAFVIGILVLAVIGGILTRRYVVGGQNRD
jgi:phospholipase D1/2